MRPSTPEDRLAHERACLAEVEQQAYNDPILKGDGTIIHEVRLQGTFPDTRILVDVQRFARRDVLEWKLWDEGNGDFGDPAPDGMPTPPEIVARDIMIILYEF